MTPKQENVRVQPERSVAGAAFADAVDTSDDRAAVVGGLAKPIGQAVAHIFEPLVVAGAERAELPPAAAGHAAAAAFAAA